MTQDPLLTDELTVLLKEFPNEVLREIVGILKRHWSLSPFGGARAYSAHSLGHDANFTLHTTEICQEILWWGSNDLHRQFGQTRNWHEIVVRAAAELGVPEDERQTYFPAWKLEDAIFRKAMADWEKMSPDERKEVLQKSGKDWGAVRGGLVNVAGIAARLAGPHLMNAMAARGAALALAGTAVFPVAVAIGTAWSAYDLGGPGYRVLRPIILMIGYNRRRLREDRLVAAFRD